MRNKKTEIPRFAQSLPLSWRVSLEEKTEILRFAQDDREVRRRDDRAVGRRDDSEVSGRAF
jgi:hypothetical protein